MAEYPGLDKYMEKIREKCDECGATGRGNHYLRCSYWANLLPNHVSHVA
jgi:hypothetical protein